ncbi:MAG TPA: rhodanese-like domain-containing protein [Blastocatellia bacterium]|nr:rhodanese-like domain-containing protein [Blastocatellia bacterium]
MRFKKLIGLLIAIMTACGIFAHPKAAVLAAAPRPAQNKAAQVEFITAEQLKAKIAAKEPVMIVDLRGQSAYDASDQTVKGSLHTKVRKVAYRLRELPRDREIVTYCSCPADEAAIIGAQNLLAKGFTRVRVLKGGWNAWLQAGGQVEPKPRL